MATSYMSRWTPDLDNEHDPKDQDSRTVVSPDNGPSEPWRLQTTVPTPSAGRHHFTGPFFPILSPRQADANVYAAMCIRGSILNSVGAASRSGIRMSARI